MRWGGTLFVLAVGCYHPTLLAGGDAGGDGGPGADGPGPDGATTPGCGSTAMLTDDFDDNVAAPHWETGTLNGGSVREEAGHVAAGGAADVADTWGYYISDRYFDFRGSHVAIEVPKLPNQASPSETYLNIRHELSLPFNTIFDMHQRQDQLHFTSWTDSTPADIFAPIPYDPTGHRFWRIRDDSGLTRFETSPNGHDWTSHGDTPTPDWAQAVAVEFGAGTVSAHPDPDEAHFDNLNGSGPTSFQWCPPSSLADDFDDGERSVAWAGTYETPSCTVTETGGYTEVSIGPGEDESCALRTALTYDLRGAGVLVDVPFAVGSYADRWVFLRVVAGSSSYEIRQGAGSILVRRTNASISEYGIRTYALLEDRWWRIKETDGTILFETSEDASTWRTLHMEPTAIPLDAVHIELGGVTTSTAATVAVVRFDRYNLPTAP